MNQQNSETFETEVEGLLMDRGQMDLLIYGALFTDTRLVHPFTVVLADFLFHYIVETTDEYFQEQDALRDFCFGELEDVVSILLKGTEDYQIPVEWYNCDAKTATQEAVRYLVTIRALFPMSAKPDLITLLGQEAVDNLSYTQQEAENHVIINMHFVDEFGMFLESAYLVVAEGKAREVSEVLEETLCECEKDGNGVIDSRYLCVKKMFDYLKNS